MLTLSLHESGRYLFPGSGGVYEIGQGSGTGYSWNWPLEPFTGDAVYLQGFQTLLEKALEWFRPDVILVQPGADAHFQDPLADLLLTAPYSGLSSVYQLTAAAERVTRPGRKSRPLTQRS